MFHVKCNKMKNCIFFFLFFFLYLGAKSQSQPLRRGVLRINLTKFSYSSKLLIQNQDGSIFAYVVMDSTDDEFKILNKNGLAASDIQKNIRSCYLDYGIMIFDSDSLNSNVYKVYVNGMEKNLFLDKASRSLISYQNLNAFMMSVFIKPNEGGKLYSDTLGNKVISGGENYSYSIKKIVNEWAYVTCLKTCEECPTEKKVSGWIKWRSGDSLLILLYYFC